MPGLSVSRDRKTSTTIAKSLLSDEWSNASEEQEVLHDQEDEEEPANDVPDQPLRLVAEVHSELASPILELFYVSEDDGEKANYQTSSVIAVQRNGLLMKRAMDDGRLIAQTDLKLHLEATHSITVVSCTYLRKVSRTTILYH